ncbi:hypothetical protein GLOTRDRAFT_140750 [Gloeophyllum trabeum ATCC 11539]|uniref:F-box domain-containing protein n=1 Tax=Gloeophyllum trabeum (strain ATCC 11539 / FP-39264 / Madison 617) TaxID=670483 RepID=S7PWJ4_GLOTA|nr:uncharacterized protein GLOTRDRAFT_140750 [Gloeophyllum trabeum ATCC 11539]EPQ51742.1 hypothetical protein GLOTRDRAFT_140750 [Gloeophyllum trabeum ATCC 11539]
MVSADNLNLDVLELIFAYLSGNDLVSVSLVSRSFFAGVIPRLYHTLGFRLSHSKKYPQVKSPFAAVMAHPDFAVHVRQIDIRTVPLIHSHPHPEFVRDCTNVIKLASNLTSFTLTVVDALPPFLPALQGKERLRDLRVYANLTSDQSAKLIGLKGLSSLVLDHASWNLVDLLPTWTRSLSASLTSLTLYMASDLNELVLRHVLSHCPHLTGLHVVGCPRADHVTVLKLASLFTPNLESLSMTSWENPRPLPPTLTPLRHLKHLALDTHCSMAPPHAPPVWTPLFQKTAEWSCPLASVTLRLSERLAVADGFVQALLDAHAGTLRSLFFVGCRLGPDALRRVCERCEELERLGVGVPGKDIDEFIDCMAKCASLRVLVDMGTDRHVPGKTGVGRVNITRDSVEDLMDITNINLVLTETRRWTRAEGEMTAKLERRKPVALSHWFMPKI